MALPNPNANPPEMEMKGAEKNGPADSLEAVVTTPVHDVQQRPTSGSPSGDDPEEKVSMSAIIAVFVSFFSSPHRHLPHRERAPSCPLHPLRMP